MTNSTGNNGRISKLLLSAAILSLSALSTAATAAKFGVHVVDENGAPVAGAAVCIGLQGNYKQFGAQFTDISGNVMVDVPNVPLLVTVSKDRFTGVRTSEPARGFNLLKQIRLMEGVPGPRCKAGSSLADSSPNPPTINVSKIDVVDGAFGTTLKPIVSGEPSHYRVSADSTFNGAVWQNYSSQIALVGNLTEAAKIYVQMRKYEGSRTSWIEARSPVMTALLTY